MTGNRLEPIASPTINRTEEELRAWCWDWNVRARQAGWPHWLHVSKDKDTEALSVKSRNGSDALDVIGVLNGERPEFVGWAKDRLDSEFRILRHMARMGMTEAEYQTRSRRFAQIAA